MIADLICLEGEKYNENHSLLLFDPIETWKKTHLAPNTYHLRDLMVPVFKNGECVYEFACRHGHSGVLQKRTGYTLG